MSESRAADDYMHMDIIEKDIIASFDIGEAFALKDAVTCMWMLKRGMVEEALDLYARGEDYGQMEQANRAAAKLDEQIRPVARANYAEMERLMSGGT